MKRLVWSYFHANQGMWQELILWGLILFNLVLMWTSVPGWLAIMNLVLIGLVIIPPTVEAWKRYPTRNANTSMKEME